MKIFFLAGVLSFLSVWPASGQVFQVDSSGNVTSSASFISNGSSPGQLTLIQGSPLVMPSATSFSLVAPASITTSYQSIVPSSGASGWWRGTYGTGATGTVTQSGNVLHTSGITITSGGTGYTIPPACWVTGGGGTGGTCSVTTVSGGAVTAVIIVNGGGSYTSTATLNFGSQVQMAFAELSGDVSTNGSNQVTVLGVNGSGAPSGSDQTIVSTSTTSAVWTTSLPNTSSNQFLTYNTGSHSFAAGTAPVISVFGRTGAVTAAANDYSLDQINNPSSAASFAVGNSNFITLGGSTSTATGTGNLVTITDGTSNNGTGSLLDIKTATSSTALPLTVTAKGTSNGVQVNNSGVLAKLGTGHVNADQCNAGTCGTVTSVTFTGDGVVDSATASSPVTSSGTVTATIINQSPNTVLAGPSSGSTALAPTFRGLVAADVPTLNQNTTGTAGGLTGTPNITVGTVTATSITGSSINQSSGSPFGGTCTTSTTSCMITIGHSYTSTPICIATEQTSTGTPKAASCSVSGAVATVTASSSGTNIVWGIFVFGNPN